MVRPSRSIPLLLSLAVACGNPRAGTDPGPGDSGVFKCNSDLDCSLGLQCREGQCLTPAEPDAGKKICTRNDECAAGFQCLKSTGECVQVKTEDAGPADAGPPPACTPGVEQSCGASKLGECRLGKSTCAATDAGTFAFSACVGDLGPKPEVCDQKDNDCDGLTDEDQPDVSCGIGACRRVIPGCEAGAGTTCTPGLPTPETCDGVDNNCNGSVDEGLVPLTCGVGVCARSIVACSMAMPQLCQPGNASAELCNGFDDDCNGLVDDGLPEIRCGIGACSRAVPACVGAMPQSCTAGLPAPMELCNGIDDNCNGQTDEGLGMISCGTGACAKSVPRCLNGVPQVCSAGAPVAETCNGVDDNCDGFVDNNLPQLFCGTGSCERNVPSCLNGMSQSCVPGQPGTEVCDNADNDCDGQIDEGLPLLTCGQGICFRSTPACDNGMPQMCVQGMPQMEACDQIDNDCDGQIDEGCNCLDGQVRSCYGGPANTAGVGTCQNGSQTCASGNWGACNGQKLPTSEVCNGSDDDCDAQIDEGFGTVTCGIGACERTINVCANGSTQNCSPGAPSTEVCDGADNDCDGATDEGLGSSSCGVGACARVVAACANGNPQTCTAGTGTTEVCDGADNDCDGATDEGLGSLSCGTGACARTVNACVNGQSQMCTPGMPGTETCNGADDDCDGSTDEGFGMVSCGQGICTRSVNSCVNGAPQSCMPGPSMTESCNSLDDDCDGVVDDGVCGPNGVCPLPQTVNPNTTVTLNTNASSPAGRPVSCQWSVQSRPATSNGNFGNPTSCTSSSYFADVVGAHVLQFRVTDSFGLQSVCTVTITVRVPGDLWVELTWDKPMHDMDLHLQHTAAGNSHTTGGWNNTLDCYWNNKTPSWDAPGTIDDPSLDRDDIPGMGPENTRINQPATTHKYVIGVHMFSNNANNPTTATVKLYCGGMLKQTFTRSFSTTKQMWVIGSVDFANAGAQGCIFTNDNFTFQLP